MGSRHVRGPLVFNTYETVLTGNYTIVNESLVIVDNSVGAATQITLPPSVTANGRREIRILDGKGDAATNNITVVPNGTDTINGGASLVLAVNDIYAVFVDLGNGVWLSPVISVSGAAAFSTLSLTGLLTESAADALTAVGTNQGTALALTAQINRVTTGASTTGVLLPLAAAGQPILVINDVANSIHVYGSGTDTINDVATATGVVQPGNSIVLYCCTTTAPAGKYYAVSSAAGAPDFGALPPFKLSTGTTTTTFTAAEMTGAALTVYTSTAATPGSIATATAAAMFAAIPNAAVGMQWVFRVINDVATNSLTITADASVTLSGKTTYVATPFGSLDFLMTFTSPTAATMQYIGGGQSTTV